MKILYVTTISPTMFFFPKQIKILKESGHIVELAANFEYPVCKEVAELNCVQHHIPFSRKVLNSGNLRAYLEIKKLIRQEHYDIVHTHTPNASAIVRIACRKLRKKGKVQVFYTAHGFHFYKGAPVRNWLLFFPVEWLCAHWTDVLITINTEDYQLAKCHMKAKRVEYVPGVGIDLLKFQEADEIHRKKEREKLGVADSEIMLLSVGELNKGKNHGIIIRAVKDIGNPAVKYFICGSGPLEKKLREKVKNLGLEKQVFLLGYRNDILELCQAADLFVFPSLREGLPVALMEAVAVKAPVICSRIRGNTDLIKEEEFLFEPHDEKGIIHCIENAIRLENKDVLTAHYELLKRYDIDIVVEIIKRQYEEISG